MGYVEYDSNNSGGKWWLKDDQWKALEKAGWVVVWAHLSELFDNGHYVHDPETGIPKIVPREQNNSGLPSLSALVKDGRYLGALAKTAYRSGLSLRQAADEWEQVTGACSTDAGCPCCGQPHRFIEYDREASTSQAVLRRATQPVGDPS